MNKVIFIAEEVKGRAIQRARLDSILGVLFFCSFAVGLDLAFYFKFFKWNRDNLHWEEDAIIPWSEEAQATLQWWVHNTIEVGKTGRKIEDIISRGPPLFLFTDASLTGWGFFYCCPSTGAFSGYGERWDKALTSGKTHINVLEIMAVTKSLAHLETRLTDKSLQLRIDNTTALYTTHKGYSSHEELNQAIKSLNEVIREKQLKIESCGYIESRRNPADVWSRV